MCPVNKYYFSVELRELPIPLLRSKSLTENINTSTDPCRPWRYGRFLLPVLVLPVEREERKLLYTVNSISSCGVQSGQFTCYIDLRIPEKREHILVLMSRRGNRFWLELALVAARQHGAFVLPVGLERARMHA